MSCVLCAPCTFSARSPTNTSRTTPSVKYLLETTHYAPLFWHCTYLSPLTFSQSDWIPPLGDTTSTPPPQRSLRFSLIPSRLKQRQTPSLPSKMHTIRPSRDGTGWSNPKFCQMARRDRVRSWPTLPWPCLAVDVSWDPPCILVRLLFAAQFFIC